MPLGNAFMFGQPRIHLARVCCSLKTRLTRGLRSAGVMVSRLQFENNNEIGVFSMLSSSYALVALGASENFYRYA